MIVGKYFRHLLNAVPAHVTNHGWHANNLCRASGNSTNVNHFAVPLDDQTGAARREAARGANQAVHVVRDAATFDGAALGAIIGNDIERNQREGARSTGSFACAWKTDRSLGSSSSQT
jgi:hypothetical protein